EESFHPPDIDLRAAAAELPIEVYPAHDCAVARARLLQVFHCPDLVWPDALMLIDEEHRHPGGPHQLVRLRDARTLVLPDEAVDRLPPDPVCFIDDEYIQAIAFGGVEIVRVPEQFLHPAAHDLLHGGGERFAAGGMGDVQAPLGQLA